jgi:PAS domain S-box-containing protein
VLLNQDFQLAQELETVCVRKDETEIDVLLAVTDVNLADGPAFLGLVQNITRRKQAEAEIKRINTTLEERVMERTEALAQANSLLTEKIAELEKSQASLNDLYSKYRIVADNTYDWEYWLAPDGQFLYTSPSCKRITGYAGEDFLRDPGLLARLIHPDDLIRWQAHTHAMTSIKYANSIEIRMCRADGETRWIGHVCLPIYNEAGQYLGNRSSNRDITEQKFAEEALYREVSRSHTQAGISSRLNNTLGQQNILDLVCQEIGHLFNAPLAMVWLLDPPTNRLHLRSVYGAPVELCQQLHPVPRQPGAPRLEKYENIDYQGNLMAEPTNPHSLLASSLGMHTLLSCWFYFDEQPVGVINIARQEVNWEYDDVDYLMLDALSNQIATVVHKAQLYEQVKAARERLTTMSEKLIEIQEAERRSLALELHDQLGQMLSSAKISLDIIPSLSQAAGAEQLQRASEIIGELISRVRRMALDLRPSMLDDMGLTSALRWFFKNYLQQTGEVVTFDQTGLDRRFSPQIEITVYRIVQEALTNVIRHAGNKRVLVKVWVDDVSLNLQITDYGSGFDPKVALRKNDSNGLSGMRERARLLGGELIVESSPGSGTVLTASLPITGVQVN